MKHIRTPGEKHTDAMKQLSTNAHAWTALKDAFGAFSTPKASFSTPPHLGRPTANPHLDIQTTGPNDQEPEFTGFPRPGRRSGATPRHRPAPGPLPIRPDAPAR